MPSSASRRDSSRSRTRGFIVGTIQTAPEISFQQMVRVSRAVADVVQHHPDVATVGMSVGAASGLTENQTRMFVSLKPRSERAASAGQIIARLGPELARIPGVQTYLQAMQDINVGGRLASTQYQFTTAGRRRERAERLGAAHPCPAERAATAP
jgi:hydrophobic/amphiphilic exporter-1 (mainly G- bacteria), HAE1 family